MFWSNNSLKLGHPRFPQGATSKHQNMIRDSKLIIFLKSLSSLQIVLIHPNKTLLRILKEDTCHPARQHLKQLILKSRATQRILEGPDRAREI
jgi:hypothetical protein